MASATDRRRPPTRPDDGRGARSRGPCSPRIVIVAGFVSTLGSEAGDSARSRLALIAPAAPGGGWDLVARESQQALKADGIVNNVQVVNIPGAAGTIGLGQLADMRGQAGTLMVTGTVMVGGIIANDSADHAGRRHPDRPARRGLRGHRGAGRLAAPEPARSFLDAWKADPAGTAIGGGSKGGTDHLLAGLVAGASGIDPRAAELPRLLRRRRGAQRAAGQHGRRRRSPATTSSPTRSRPATSGRWPSAPGNGSRASTCRASVSRAWTSS